jgi:hypothetical protein
LVGVAIVVPNVRRFAMNAGWTLADLTRRRFLQLGGSGAVGLHLGGLWRAQAAAAERPAASLPRIRACILVFYYGGPSHLDTYDLKPQAPDTVRGEFKPISTSVPGLQICEHLPHMAQVMHKAALVRSVHHTNNLHDSASIETLTGRQAAQGDREEFAPIPQFFPAHGAALNSLRRDLTIEAPHVALPFPFRNVIEVPCQGGGFLGNAFDPLQVQVDDQARIYRLGSFDRPAELPDERRAARRTLLRRLDELNSAAEMAAGVREVQRLYDKAYQLLTSERLYRALDLARESSQMRERYGFGPTPLAVGEGGGGGNGSELGFARHMRGQNLLLARRLVEAGVPFVNVYDFRQQGQNWDAHFNVFNQHKTHLLPLADQSLAALITDLDERGLLDSTLVVATGEFGRTPTINAAGGRDHWPQCYTTLLAGGGVRGGAVWGSSDRLGAFPATDPVTPADLAATIFWRFGIDPATEIHDRTGRPYRVADGQPLRRLFGEA